MDVHCHICGGKYFNANGDCLNCKAPTSTIISKTLGKPVPLNCNHCYCQVISGGTNPHRKCCKCGDVMAAKFIK